MPFDGKSLEANSPVVTLLREARGRIERGFTHNRFMRDNVSPPQYCMIGAVINRPTWSARATPTMLAAFGFMQRAIEHYQRTPWALTGLGGIAAFNNSHTQQEVLAVFDKAIELAIADALVTA